MDANQPRSALQKLLLAWHDHHGKPSMTRILASLIILVILGFMCRALLTQQDFPERVAALSEFMVTAMLTLLGVNSVGLGRGATPPPKDAPKKPEEKKSPDPAPDPNLP